MSYVLGNVKVSRILLENMRRGYASCRRK